MSLIDLALQIVARQFAYLWHIIGENVPSEAFKQCDRDEPYRGSSDT
jgi:hypothetical protein